MKRKAFLRLCERYRRQSKQFVYIDGSGFAPTINRIHDDAPQGTPVYGETGSGHKRLRTSTSLWEGTCNAQIFNDWLEKQCLHTLHENHVLIMDNADFHKSNKTKDLIESKGSRLLYLPLCSPDLNPMENDFASIKKLRRFNYEKSIGNFIKTYQ